MGMVAAGVIVLLFIAFRYRHPEHLIPLIFVATTQMIILISFMATFGTLDLSTIAGLFGTLGTSVDYQIVITDEILGRGAGGRDEAKRRLEKAKYIISRDVGVLTVIMLPLMFSNIVEIIGFATTTLIGSLLGLAITTLVYNAVIDKSYKE
jgi:preprotein translocase subunit SecD